MSYDTVRLWKKNEGHLKMPYFTLQTGYYNHTPSFFFQTCGRMASDSINWHILLLHTIVLCYGYQTFKCHKGLRSHLSGKTILCLRFKTHFKPSPGAKALQTNTHSKRASQNILLMPIWNHQSGFGSRYSIRDH